MAHCLFFFRAMRMAEYDLCFYLQSLWNCDGNKLFNYTRTEEITDERRTEKNRE